MLPETPATQRVVFTFALGELVGDRNGESMSGRLTENYFIGADGLALVPDREYDRFITGLSGGWSVSR